MDINEQLENNKKEIEINTTLLKETETKLKQVREKIREIEKKPLLKHSFDLFGKTNYLLGIDKDGIKYYLQSPSWDCDWYWGFGYIETFTNNNNPEKSRDINSHSHATKFMSEYFTDWNGSKPILVKTTFTNKEGWELCELFEQFYFLQSAAANFGRGKCHVANTSIEAWVKPELAKEINQIIIPKVTARILEILTPESN